MIGLIKTKVKCDDNGNPTRETSFSVDQDGEETEGSTTILKYKEFRMTKQQAKQALAAMQQEYLEKPMVIRVLDKFKGNPLVDSIFKALRPASIGMITAALIGVVKESLLHLENFAGLGTILSIFNWKGIVLAVVLWFVMKKWKTHPIAYIAIAAAAGIVFSF